jgi:hypothetical protein
VRLLHSLRSMVAVLLGRRRFERAMSAELQFHIDACADDLVRAGVSRAEAERRARAEFGGAEGL